MKTPAQVATEVGDFHDSVLLSIDMQWIDGTVTLGLRTAIGPKRIVVQQVTRLICPREHPWGRSACVNEVRLSSLQSGEGVQLEMEMQSGDVLVILGSKISAEP